MSDSRVPEEPETLIIQKWWKQNAIIHGFSQNEVTWEIPKLKHNKLEINMMWTIFEGMTAC